MSAFGIEFAPLERYGHNLTLLARQGVFSPLAGSEATVTRIFEILLRREKGTGKYNPLILDIDGTSRWLVIVEAIRRMAMREAPDALCEQQVIALDYTALFADISDDPSLHRRLVETLPLNDDELVRNKPETWEALNKLFRWPDLEDWAAPNTVLERLQAIFIALHQAEGSFLLFIDHFHRLLGGNSQHYSINAATLLKPTLARGEIQMIGACTLSQYQQHIERDAAISRRFQEISHA